MRNLFTAIRNAIKGVMDALHPVIDWAAFFARGTNRYVVKPALTGIGKILEAGEAVVTAPFKLLGGLGSARSSAPGTGPQQEALAAQQAQAIASARYGATKAQDHDDAAYQREIGVATQLRRLNRKIIRGLEIEAIDLQGIPAEAAVWLAELTLDQRKLLTRATSDQVVAHLKNEQHIEGVPTIVQAFAGREQRLAQFTNASGPSRDPVISSESGFANRLRATREAGWGEDYAEHALHA